MLHRPVVECPLDQSDLVETPRFGGGVISEGSMSAHRKSSSLATAALMEIISNAQALQAAILRGAKPAEIEAIRGAGHDLLDIYLDHTASAATQVRAIIEP